MKRNSGNRVQPFVKTQDGVNDKFGMDTIEKDNRKKQRFKEAVDKVNPISALANAKMGANRWIEYCSNKRTYGGSEKLTKRTTSLGLHNELSQNYAASKKIDEVDLGDGHTQQDSIRRTQIDQNSSLIRYFASLAADNDVDKVLNLDYIEDLFKKGAKVNCTDIYGQTVLHEAARNWHSDVAQFLIENGANVNQGDHLGRTPLHMAAAIDYPEMCVFLINNGASKEAHTTEQLQTAVHFAAKNDAVHSLKALIKMGCKYEDIRDYKMRTPLHVAAELDRSETARYLLDIDTPARVEDESGLTAISLMINKMPPMAKLALDQFHTTDRANRQQYFHLDSLEPRKPDDERPGFPQTPLLMAATYRRYDLITHTVFEELINLKWKRFGRRRALISTAFNFIFIVLWTIQGLVIDYDKRHNYDLPQEWWRIVLFLLAICFTVKQIYDEITEYFSSKKHHKEWCEWKEEEIKKDLKFCHERWPDEEKYLRSEIEELDSISPQYFNDFWNIFDWICYTLLFVCILTHIIDVAHHTNFIARLHIRIMAVTIILIWLRLMKNARAFSSLGPFIVMISHMVGQVLKFVILYTEFYIPYACAFWMMFGGTKTMEKYQGLPHAENQTTVVDGYATVDALLFSMFRLTLVDEYDYEGMKSVDYIMADILVGTWFALSSIVMLNLFIALMSDTFQRVYDNAKANAVMQKAITILNIEEGLNQKERDEFRAFIHEKCSPEKKFYDDDATESGELELKKVTTQIKLSLDRVEKMFSSEFESEPDYNSKDIANKFLAALNPSTRAAKDKLSTIEEQLNEDRQQLDPLYTSKSASLTTTRNNNTLATVGSQRTVTRPPKTTVVVMVHQIQNRLDNLEDSLAYIKHTQQKQYDRQKRDMKSMHELLHDVLRSVKSKAVESTTRSSSSRRAHRETEPTTTTSPIVHSQEPVILPSRSHTLDTSPASGSNLDTEWSRMEQQRQADLQRLRNDLSEQQQLLETRELRDAAGQRGDDQSARDGL